MDKRKTMAQLNLFQNSRFVNYTQIPSLCEKSGAIALVLQGLTAGWLAGWQSGRQAGRQAGRRNSAKFRNF